MASLQQRFIIIINNHFYCPSHKTNARALQNVQSRQRGQKLGKKLKNRKQEKWPKKTLSSSIQSNMSTDKTSGSCSKPSVFHSIGDVFSCCLYASTFVLTSGGHTELAIASATRSAGVTPPGEVVDVVVRIPGRLMWSSECDDDDPGAHDWRTGCSCGVDSSCVSWVEREVSGGSGLRRPAACTTGTGRKLSQLTLGRKLITQRRDSTAERLDVAAAAAGGITSPAK